MKTFGISYPETVIGARAELSGPTDERDVRIIAGGQDLLGEMKDGTALPDHLVSLERIPELREVRLGCGVDDSVIGATVTVATLAGDAGIGERFPMLAEAAASIGTPQIRNLGTLGGNLCQRPRCLYYRSEAATCLTKGGSTCFAYSGLNKHNAILGGGPNYILHPSDLAPALCAYDASVEIVQPGSGLPSVKSLTLGDFFTLPSVDPEQENVLEPGELVSSVTIPDRAGWKATYLKVKARHSYDFALSAVAVALRFEGDRVADARIVLGAVAPIPWRCRSTEQLLSGEKLDEETIRAAREDALRRAKPLSQNGYKIPMTQGLLTRAFRKLAGEE